MMIAGLLAALTMIGVANAYVGPGLGLGMIIALIAVFAVFVLAIVAFVYYPLKRVRRKMSARSNADQRGPREDVSPQHR